MVETFYLVVRSKGKIDFTNVSKLPPKDSYLSYVDWDINKSMVMSWLINSMKNSFAKIYLLYSMAKITWDVVTTAYSDICSRSKCYINGGM